MREYCHGNVFAFGSLFGPSGPRLGLLIPMKPAGIKSESARFEDVILLTASTLPHLIVTRLDRLARLTRDLLNTLDRIGKVGAGFRSLADTWADTTTPHGRLMVAVPAGLAEFERALMLAPTAKGGHGRWRGARAVRGNRRCRPH